MKKVGEIVHLNVGGKRLLDGKIPSLRDESGAIFIDRDPEMFRIILNYLRTNDLSLKGVDVVTLKHEAQFYGLDSLVRKLSLCEENKLETCGDLLFHTYIPSPDFQIDDTEIKCSSQPHSGEKASFYKHRHLGMPTKPITLIVCHQNMMATAYMDSVGIFLLKDSIGWHLVWLSPTLPETIDRIALTTKTSHIHSSLLVNNTNINNSNIAVTFTGTATSFSLLPSTTNTQTSVSPTTVPLDSANQIFPNSTFSSSSTATMQASNSGITNNNTNSSSNSNNNNNNNSGNNQIGAQQQLIPNCAIAVSTGSKIYLWHISNAINNTNNSNNNNNNNNNSNSNNNNSSSSNNNNNSNSNNAYPVINSESPFNNNTSSSSTFNPLISVYDNIVNSIILNRSEQQQQQQASSTNQSDLDYTVHGGTNNPRLVSSRLTRSREPWKGELIGQYDLKKRAVDHLLFIGVHLVALSRHGLVGVRHVMTNTWQVWSTVPILSYGVAGSELLLLGCANGCIYSINIQKFPLRIIDNDLLVTEMYRDPQCDPITALSVCLTPRNAYSSRNWMEIAYGTFSGRVCLIVQHPEIVGYSPQLFQTFNVHRSMVTRVVISERFLISVCNDFHVRTWAVTRFRGIISTQPSSTPVGSFSITVLDTSDPHNMVNSVIDSIEQYVCEKYLNINKSVPFSTTTINTTPTTSTTTTCNNGNHSTNNNNNNNGSSSDLSRIESSGGGTTVPISSSEQNRIIQNLSNSFKVTLRRARTSHFRLSGSTTTTNSTTALSTATTTTATTAAAAASSSSNNNSNTAATTTNNSNNGGTSDRLVSQRDHKCLYSTSGTNLVLSSNSWLHEDSAQRWVFDHQQQQQQRAGNYINLKNHNLTDNSNSESSCSHSIPHKPIIQAHQLANNPGPYGEREDVILFVQKVTPNSNQLFVRLASNGLRVCLLHSVDGSSITSFIVHEMDGFNRVGAQPRRYLFTGHANGTVQVWDLTTALNSMRHHSSLNPATPSANLFNVDGPCNYAHEISNPNNITAILSPVQTPYQHHSQQQQQQQQQQHQNCYVGGPTTVELMKMLGNCYLDQQSNETLDHHPSVLTSNLSFDHD